MLFCCSRSAVVNGTFLFLPQLHFLVSICRNPVFSLVFLLSHNFAACSVHISLICCRCVSMSLFPSSGISCSASYLFLTVSRKVFLVNLSFRKSTLYCVLVFLLTSLFFSFIFIVASTRWWSEAASAPLCTLTSCIYFLNFRPMQIWSI